MSWNARIGKDIVFVGSTFFIPWLFSSRCNCFFLIIAFRFRFWFTFRFGFGFRLWFRFRLRFRFRFWFRLSLRLRFFFGVEPCREIVQVQFTEVEGSSPLRYSWRYKAFRKSIETFNEKETDRTTYKSEWANVNWLIYFNIFACWLKYHNLCPIKIDKHYTVYKTHHTVIQ